MYGIRPLGAPPNAGRTDRLVDRIRDLQTRLSWLSPGALVTQAELPAAGCGAGLRAPTVGELVTLVGLRTVPEFILDPAWVQPCVWGPPSGDGRWRLRPYFLPNAPFLDVVPAGDGAACLAACLEAR